MHARFAKCTAKSRICEHYVHLRDMRLCTACFCVMSRASAAADLRVDRAAKSACTPGAADFRRG
jgi:hypothetical protein